MEEAESDEEAESEVDGSGEEAAVLPPQGGPHTSDTDCSGACPDTDCGAPVDTISPPTQVDERPLTVPLQQSCCVSSGSEGTCAEKQEVNTIDDAHQSLAPATEEPCPSQCAATEHLEAEEGEEVNWREFSSARDLEGLGRSKLKAISVSLGLKCGGTLQQLAARVFSTMGKEREEWDPHILAKPVKG